MRYNWHRVAESGPLPLRFRHGLVGITDNSARISMVYAIGRNEENKDLEVFELDSNLESWNKVPFLFENELARKALTSRQQEFLLAGAGSSIYMIERTSSSGKGATLLKFDTVERKWCTKNVSGRSAEASEVVAAATAGEKIVLLGDNELSTDVYLLDTINNRWTAPKILGTPPCPRDGFSCLTLEKDRLLVYDDKDNWLLKIGTPHGRAGEEVISWGKARRDTLPVVICGPSGVGKGTLIAKLMQEFPDKFGFSVSHTTRKPREKELDGVHYHFTSRDSMELAVNEGMFLEHANVHGNMYGTSISAVEAVSDGGKRCILDIDVQGAKSVRQSSMEALFIFILPPSFEELEKRLRGRGTETEEQVMKRLQNAKRELELGKDPFLFDHVLVNDDLESTYKQLKGILGLVDDGAEIPASRKLVTGLKPEIDHIKVHLVDVSPGFTKWQPVEASEKQIPCKYTNALHLSDLEILMTANDGESIVVRLGK
ncbi:guanylate kinase 1 [Selaginella moellendorffii]|uniref:guanylate kinase 1 n=1 Tax=Selaginella moellendorffii TaxID=88036 RepID=UPI000D1CAFE7|nr:guanylate kinase 1 [Selaginella moellendorffii]|eukprot:XP_024527108.1 guanylate kinase 1 [Selaginella moellendorffii]